MRTNKLLCYFLVGFILLYMTNCSNAQLQNHSKVNNDYSEEQIVLMLKNFYTSYINETSKSPSNPEKEDSIRKKFCTTNMMKVYDLPDLDYDPIVQAQMVLKECAETLTIRKDKDRENIYYVSYNWPLNDKEQITIKVKIVKENEDYKIDYVFLDYPSKQKK